MAETILRPIAGGLLILVALLGLIGTAIKNPKPHDIQVGLVGPPPAVQQISTGFGSNAPGAFRFTSYESEGAARAAIDARSVDGALLLESGGPRLIVAGAAGDAVTGVTTGQPGEGQDEGQVTPASRPRGAVWVKSWLGFDTDAAGYGSVRDHGR